LLFVTEAFSSPFTLASPSSSDFETISDSEFILNKPPPHPYNAPVNHSRNHQDAMGDDSTSSTPDPRASLNPLRRIGSLSDESEVADADDEVSGVEDGDEMRGRGRGRTKRREDDPAMKKSMLEDALRSR
jgi:hypothetical protein